MKGILEFAHKDYELVHKEISDLKSGGTGRFLGVLGTVATLALLIVQGYRADSSSSWQMWLPVAWIIPTCLLAFSGLVAVENSRGINERSAYAEVLSEYLVRGEAPPCYCGWFKASETGRRCMSYRRMRRWHDGGTEDDPTCGSKMLCKSTAKVCSARTAKYVAIIPSVLASFTSLSAHIYAGLYMLSVIVLLFAIINSIPGSVGASPAYYWLAVAYGVVATFVAFILTVTMEHRVSHSVRHGLRESFFAQRVFMWYRVLGAFALPFLFILGLTFADARLAQGLIYALGGTIAAVAVLVGLFFCGQVLSLRRGRHSLERYRHMWRIRFERCPLMAAPTPCE